MHCPSALIPQHSLRTDTVISPLSIHPYFEG